MSIVVCGSRLDDDCTEKIRPGYQGAAPGVEHRNTFCACERLGTASDLDRHGGTHGVDRCTPTKSLGNEDVDVHMPTRVPMSDVVGTHTHRAEPELAERGIDEDLNAPGSSFVPLAFDQSTHLPQPGVRPGASAPNRFYMYGVIGRLAMVAASYELEATDPDAEVYS